MIAGTWQQERGMTAGAASWEIRKQTGHKSDAMVARYIRQVELYSNNVARLVM